MKLCFFARNELRNSGPGTVKLSVREPRFFGGDVQVDL